MSSKTAYTATSADAEETFATKQAAIRFGEKLAVPFVVTTSAGNTVYESIEPADDEDVLGDVKPKTGKAKAAKASKAEKDASKDVDGHVLNYREVGPKHFYRALTEPVLTRFKGSSRGRDFTVTVPEAEVTKVVNAWGDALEALKAFKKENATYKRQSTKTDEGRKVRYDMEQEFLSAQVKKALK
jgi:hypothetical protein